MRKSYKIMPPTGRTRTWGVGEVMPNGKVGAIVCERATKAEAEQEMAVYVRTSVVPEFMEAAGYEVFPTGGGCETWQRVCPDKTVIWICTESQSTAGDPEAAVWLIGRHDEECGAVEIEGTHTLAACVEMAARIPAPKVKGTLNRYVNAEEAFACEGTDS